MTHFPAFEPMTPGVAKILNTRIRYDDRSLVKENVMKPKETTEEHFGPPRVVAEPHADILEAVENKPTKFDTGKRRWNLFPFDAAEEIVKVLEHGAEKYAPHNWEKGFDWTRLTDAIMRHAIALSQGQDTDPDSGLPTAAHLGCEVLFYIAHAKRGLGRDDRHKIVSS